MSAGAYDQGHQDGFKEGHVVMEDDMPGNIYYSPEDYGLKVFVGVSNPALYYGFSMLVVWQDKDGTLFYAEDSGCSCPEPFESIVGIGELGTIVGADGLKAFFDALTSWGTANTEDTYGDPCTVDITSVRRKVREYMTRA